MRNIRISFLILALTFIVSLNAGQAHAAAVSKCKTCHSFEQGAEHRTGPNLYGIVGKKAGTAKAYRYSTCLKNAGFIWTEDKLRAWITNPKAALQKFTDCAKTRMPAQKVSGAKLDAVIDYLVSISPKPRMARMSRTMNTMAVAPKAAAKNGVSHAAPKPVPKAIPAPTAAPAPAAPTSSPALKRSGGIVGTSSLERRAEMAKSMEIRTKDVSVSGDASRSIASVQPMMAEMEGDPTAGLPATAAGPSAPESMPPAAPNGHGDTRVRMGALASSAPGTPATDEYEKYKVELGADSILNVGIPGELWVWIGDPKYKGVFRPEMNRVTGEIAAVGDKAIIKPFVPTGLKVSPLESECIAIDPTGSSESFELMPEKKGIYKVGATVYLYGSNDCSDTPTPKAAKKFQVEVRVDETAKWNDRSEKLLDILWDKFVEFWGAVVVLFFGAVLFLLRKKLKKWFGYEE